MIQFHYGVCVKLRASIDDTVSLWCHGHVLLGNVYPQGTVHVLLLKLLHKVGERGEGGKWRGRGRYDQFGQVIKSMFCTQVLLVQHSPRSQWKHWSCRRVQLESLPLHLYHLLGHILVHIQRIGMGG